jgi:hypothetical protein
MDPSQAGPFVPITYDSEHSSSDEYDSEDMVLGSEFPHLSGDVYTPPGSHPHLDIFPYSELAMLTDGLNRLPSWTVFPNHLANCLKATCRILSSDRGAIRYDHRSINGSSSGFCFQSNFSARVYDNSYCFKVAQRRLWFFRVLFFRGPPVKFGLEARAFRSYLRFLELLSFPHRINCMWFYIHMSRGCAFYSRCDFVRLATLVSDDGSIFERLAS